MSSNIEQIYSDNPVTVLSADDLFYLGQKSGETHVDGAIKKSDLEAQLSGVSSNLIWVSATASPGGTGSIGNPFTTVSAAYAAGIALSAPFLIGLFPGSYFEPATVLQLVDGSGFFGFSSENTSLVLGSITLDQTSWNTSGNVATFSLQGLTFSSTGAGMFLSVPTFGDGAMLMRDVVFKQQAGESYVWENFVDEISIADCDFSNINPKFFGCFLRDVGSKFTTLNVSSYDPDVGTPINNCRLSANGSRITTLYLKSQTGNLVHAILNSIDTKDMTNFFVEGDDITVWKSANVPDPTITSGTPTINNLDRAENVFANYMPSNYTPVDDTVKGNLQGIDAALSTAGFAKVYVTGGYQEVAPNTIYYTRSPGKVIFQVPVTFPKGSTFQIIGASESQNGWELWTQLGQSLIYQDVITDIASNIYAFAKCNYYRDTATFTAIDDNVQIQCIQYDGAGLAISEETSVDIPLTTVTSTPFIVLAAAKIISGYSGYLAKVLRSDSATAFVSPDFANRASQLSDLDIGGKLADWAAGFDVNIQYLDQSGNGNDATNSGAALWIDSGGNVMNVNGRPSARTAPGVNYMQAAMSSFTGSSFTVVAGAARNNASYQSSIATLYNPANGDDYGSALDNVSFYEDNSPVQFVSVRNANLSAKSFPTALNTAMVISNRFNGSNNTIRVNGVDGTSPASSGAFSFNKLLMGGRYVSGGITTIGDYKLPCILVYPAALSGAEIDDLDFYINQYLM